MKFPISPSIRGRPVQVFAEKDNDDEGDDDDVDDEGDHDDYDNYKDFDDEADILLDL